MIYSKHFAGGTKVNVFDEKMAEADMAEIINQDILYDHEFEGRKRKVAIRQLENGMCLAVTVPVSEINQSFYRLIFQIIVGGGCVIIVFVVVLLLGLSKKISNENKEKIIICICGFGFDFSNRKRCRLWF